MNRKSAQAESESSSLPAGSVNPAPLNKKNWTSPHVTALPRLTDITLQSGGIPGGGGTGGGGSTVVP